jgi:ACS family glucarate transporter-like MFS transporter
MSSDRQYCCLSFGWYFYITWLPTFLDEKLKLSLNQGAFYGILPLFLDGLGSCPTQKFDQRVK